jgi:hypothetical protein
MKSIYENDGVECPMKSLSKQLANIDLDSQEQRKHSFIRGQIAYNIEFEMKAMLANYMYKPGQYIDRETINRIDLWDTIASMNQEAQRAFLLPWLGGEHDFGTFEVAIQCMDEYFLDNVPPAGFDISRVNISDARILIHNLTIPKLWFPITHRIEDIKAVMMNAIEALATVRTKDEPLLYPFLINHVNKN